MKIMKFGGTSVGNPDRMRSIIPLITGEEKVITVLSALSGTTNSLVEISDLMYAGKAEEASQKNEALRSKYFQVVEDLYATDHYKKEGHELVNSHFDYIGNIILNAFTKLQEKAIVAQGELISTTLFHNLLRERNISSVFYQH